MIYASTKSSVITHRIVIDAILQVNTVMIIHSIQKIAGINNKKIRRPGLPAITISSYRSCHGTNASYP
jgi:hypothetical protein